MQWQPIETAPKDGTEVILCRATDADGRPIVGEDFGVFVQVAGWWTDRWVVYCSMVLDPGLHFEPTHWMSLPAPPDTQRTDPQDEYTAPLNMQFNLKPQEAWYSLPEDDRVYDTTAPAPGQEG